MHLDAKLVISLNQDLVITAEGVTTTIRKEAAGPFLQAIQAIAREIRGEPQLEESEPEPEPEPVRQAREEPEPEPQPQPQLQLPEPEPEPERSRSNLDVMIDHAIAEHRVNGHNGHNGNAIPSLAAFLARKNGPVFRERHHPLIRKRTMEATLLVEAAKLGGIFSIVELKRHLFEASLRGEEGEETALLPGQAAPVARCLRDKGLIESIGVSQRGRSYGYRLTDLGAMAVYELQKQD
jgi:hypothetical protein